MIYLYYFRSNRKPLEVTFFQSRQPLLFPIWNFYAFISSNIKYQFMNQTAVKFLKLLISRLIYVPKDIGFWNGSREIIRLRILRCLKWFPFLLAIFFSWRGGQSTDDIRWLEPRPEKQQNHQQEKMKPFQKHPNSTMDSRHIYIYI